MPTTLTPAERKTLKARAHAIDPVVIIGDAGLTPGVLAEIDRSLVAHQLIKVRVTGDHREARVLMRDAIVAGLDAAPVQTIGKLLILFRPAPVDDATAWPVARKTAKKAAKKTRAVERNAALRNPARKVSTRKTPANAHPPRTERVRKSGQRSAKKPFQNK